MAAPTPSIDTEGIMSWTIDTEPYQWIISYVFPDGTKPPNINFDFIPLPGSTDSYDLTTIFPGGYKVILYGIDANGNLEFTPSITEGVTINQGIMLMNFLSAPKKSTRKRKFV
jgi:hypothetical protein